MKPIILPPPKWTPAVLFRGNTITNVIIPAWEVQALDTTATGDCFIGALAVGLSERKSIINAAMFANAAAAISVTRAGAQPSLPYYGEVIQFLEKWNN